ncbi:methionyl-tRNA formyltransferase [Petrotoga sp. 9PW.55.5.1]|uniref:methionyl-tRNA formyltransferase n=1 Tax=Petrotoga sp. 9PW.55.5.1 TaxID=1308979 RepID=UPI000DC4FB82|nr:methionyl-tRNA formyltransferase [Petrotoga sp. 9PW.55.5.1]RAO98948.1 methionyl-tRNA formyltransferase [Petrotoga sp. 9PW.55.5.1]
MMKKNNFRIVFMGTPEFGAEILEELLKNKYNVVGVFSQPDKPRGRGKKLQPTPVKHIAEKYDIPVYQPKSVSKGEGFQILSELNPNLIITAAFGKILRKNVLELPEKGCWNVHASLLPKYRGAAPIQRAIENGERESGITVFKMVEALDAGDMAIQRKVAIDINDNFETVYNKLLSVAKITVIEFLERFDELKLTPQNDQEACYAEKLTKGDLIIDFNKSAFEVHNKIRAYDPYPGAKARYEGEEVKLFSSVWFDELSFENGNEAPGSIIKKKETGILIKCKQGAIKIKEIQFPGRKRICVIDAINGNKLKIPGHFNS